MRLRQIKIAGFKSFADLTVIDIDVPLIGIVGPNGCGKSNIIDAVRWVLGAGRASELRGQSRMMELIFAGSAGRAELGRASVELLLENDGTIEGPWQSYAEIAVKRVVTRDGDSTYTINRQVVRRRDVQELFAGTGLGTNSYAIISQGTITNFMKARPEELRNYFEEAAGVALYRERRRETETLLRQTRENLERAADLQSVKKETMERLRAEAETAKRWEALDEERRTAEAFLFYRQREEAREEVAAMDRTIGELARSSDEIRDRLSGLEKEGPEYEACFEKARTEHAALESVVRESERAMTKLEALIAEEKRRQAEAEETLKVAQAALREKQSEKEQLAAELEADEERVSQLTGELQGLEEAATHSADLVRAAEGALTEARCEAEHEEAEWRRRQSALEAARAKERSLADRLAALERHRMLQKETARPVVSDASEEAVWHERLELARKDKTEAEAVRERLARRAQAAERTVMEVSRAYEKALADEKTCAARRDAVREALRQAGRSNELGRWLEKRGLAQAPRVSTFFTVADSWAAAADALLAADVNARLLSDVPVSVAQDRTPAPAALWMAAADHQTPEALGIGRFTFEPFFSHCTILDERVLGALTERLAGHYAAPDLREALSVQAELPEGAVLVTPQGDRITRRRVSLWAKTTEGVLTLTQKVRAAESRYEEAKANFDKARSDRDEAQHEERTVRESQRQAARTLHDAEEAVRKIEWSQKRFLEQKREAERRLAEIERRERLLEEEHVEIVREAEVAKAERLRLEAEDTGDVRREALRKTVNDRQGALEHARSEQKALDYRKKLLTLEIGECRKSMAATRVRRERVVTDCAREASRIEKAEATIAAADGSAEAELAARRTAHEQAVAAAADGKAREEGALASLNRLREEERRLRAEWLPVTESLGRKKTDRQAKFVLYEQFSERFRETGYDDVVMAARAATDDARVPALRQRVQRLASELQRLGVVNHAALAGLREAEEAYETARRQMEDLEKAAQTLEGAIRKIDAETRTRIRTTFDAVAGAFEATFRELFGGGEAKLVMTGDDVLEAGIEVMARPPGKKNATLSLLSGGEQSLTATALVFAFFRLNPAPFCLLDEVDTALDEANQGRLASLCRRFSDKTQFLFITHHRVTMEYADVLIGVTMREPGVSRVVSVDVEEATRWAAGTPVS